MDSRSIKALVSLQLTHVAPRTPFQPSPTRTYITPPPNNRTTYLAIIEALDYDTIKNDQGTVYSNNYPNRNFRFVSPKSTRTVLQDF